MTQIEARTNVQIAQGWISSCPFSNPKGLFVFINNIIICTLYGPCSSVGIATELSVGIATELRAGWSGIESRWGRDFPPVQTGPGAHLASCTMGTGSFPGVKCGRGVLLTTHPLLVPRSRAEFFCMRFVLLLHSIMGVKSPCIVNSTSYDTHRQALSKYNSTHITRHAAT